MIEINKVNVYNFENAVRGARNPMNSWNKMDSDCKEGQFNLGSNDLTLLSKLCKLGCDHRKFMRQILVSVDIKAPLYWWKEMDQYRIGITSNSCSTMHKIQNEEITINHFSHDKMNLIGSTALYKLIDTLEFFRKQYNETKDKQMWYNLIQLLPSSWNQLRTCTLNYENLINIYYNRKNHKLDEWKEFCNWIETLPYSQELITNIKDDK